MTSGSAPCPRIQPLKSLLLVSALCLCSTAPLAGQAAPQADSDVPPGTVPQIQQVNPSEVKAGDRVTVIVQGTNFSGGVLVSSASPTLRIESFRRLSATQLEVQLSVAASAQPETVSLLVTNPASRTAETAIVITGTPAAPPGSVEPSTPASPVAPSNPPAPASPANPPAPTSPAAPGEPSGPPAPEVATVEPTRAGPGMDVNLRVTGKNFVPGTNVSFSNPGVRVLGITCPSSTELIVHIKVAFDALPSVASLFVVNPDDAEVEAPFEVTAKVATKTPRASPAPAPILDSAATQRYSAFHLGSPAEVFQTRGRVKGSLVASSDAIQYQEAGKVLVNISMSAIREIKVSSVASATFHITLISGKSYHFAPGSLRPADARNMVDSLRAALPKKSGG